MSNGYKRFILCGYSFHCQYNTSCSSTLHGSQHVLSSVKKKNGYIEWLQYTPSHHDISKTGQTKKNYIRTCLDIGDLEQNP